MLPQKLFPSRSGSLPFGQALIFGLSELEGMRRLDTSRTRCTVDEGWQELTKTNGRKQIERTSTNLFS
jgi:hypothetical protein